MDNFALKQQGYFAQNINYDMLPQQIYEEV